MRIVIDMQGAQSASRYRGIGRYTKALVQAIIEEYQGKHDILLALNGTLSDIIQPIRDEFRYVLPRENIRVWYAPGNFHESNPANSIDREFAEIIREEFLLSLNPDVLLISSLFEGYLDDSVTSIGVSSSILTGVILYDLIPLMNADQYLEPNPEYKKYYLGKIDHLSRANFYLAISESSRQEAIRELGLHTDSVFNISAGKSDFFIPRIFSQTENEAIRQKFSIKGSFILYTGASDERKNLPRLIQAYSALPRKLRETYQLVLGGGMDISHVDNFKKIARTHGLKQEELCFTGVLADEELVQLYNICSLYVFPSWHEGFGLPALEAMSCGAPTIGSNATSIPEVIGLDDALFNPLDISSIAEKIEKTLTCKEFSKHLKQHGLRHSQKFTWAHAAEKTIAAMVKSHERSESPNAVEDSALPFHQIAEKAKQSTRNLVEIANCLSKNYPQELNPQLLIDISELIQRDAKSGIQRVVRNILAVWLRRPLESYKIRLVYATENKAGYYYADKFADEFLDNLSHDHYHGVPIDYAPGDIFFGLDLQPLVQTSQANFYQHLRRQGVLVIFLVHDLLCIDQAEYFPSGAEEDFSKWLKVICECDGAICVSKFTANQLNNWMADKTWNRSLPFSIKWNHNGADIERVNSKKALSTENEEQLSILKSTKTFLMVGTVEPRKGHAQTLDAFEKLWQSDFSLNLIIVGKQGWMVEDLVTRIRNHEEFNSRLFWLEGISDEYLEQLYKQSNCLIAASYGEGFGLPLIEAAQYKLPIIARDIPVFREVAGEHAYYFEGTSTDEFVSKIEQWIRLYSLEKHPKSDQMPWLTWEESANELMNIILEEK